MAGSQTVKLNIRNTDSEENVNGGGAKTESGGGRLLLSRETSGLLLSGQGGPAGAGDGAV